MARKRFGTEIRHEQIAQAALEIVRDDGVRALSVAAVAQKVGVVPSALYRHFENKSAIVGAVLRLIQARLNAHFQEVVQLEMGALEKLHLMLTRHVGLIAGNNAIPRIVFSEEILAGLPERRRQLYEVIRDVIGNVATLVREGQATGVIRRDLAPETIAVSFMGMIQPAAILWDLSQGQFDLPEHARQAWKLFSRAVAAQGDAEDGRHPSREGAP